jgi:hypothetical protein
MLKDYFEVPNKPAIKSGNVLSCDFTDHETFIPQPLDFTRNTLATYVDCNGLIKVSGVSDTELVTNGDFATDSDWTKGDGWTISGGTANCDGSQSATTNFFQSAVISDLSKTYRVEFTLSNYAAGTIKSKISNSAQGANRSANGIYVDFFSGMTNTALNFTASSDFIGSIDNVSVKEVDLNTPRIDYLTEIGKAKELQKPSLLLEPQSTNKFTRSEQFSNSYWSKTNCIVQQSTITSPDGLQSSYKLIPDAGTGGNRSLGRSLTGLSNFHTFSVFARAGEYKYAILRTRNNPIVVVSFNLENGTFNVNQSSAVYVTDSAKMENYGNGWYRCSITLDPSQANTVGQLYSSVSVGITGNETNDFDGDGISGIYVFGAQLEEQNYVTSYIPTSGSTVTRNGEVCNNAGSAPVFNSEEGTFYAEIAALADDFTPREMTLNGGNTSNRLVLSFNASNQIRVDYTVSSSLQVRFNRTADMTKFNKVAFKYKVNDFKLYLNGSLSGTDTSGSVPAAGTFNNFDFSNGSNNFNFYGRIKEIKAFRRTLTDSEMAELTNNIV